MTAISRIYLNKIAWENSLLPSNNRSKNLMVCANDSFGIGVRMTPHVNNVMLQIR